MAKINLKIHLKSIQMKWDNLEDCDNTKLGYNKTNLCGGMVRS